MEHEGGKKAPSKPVDGEAKIKSQFAKAKAMQVMSRTIRKTGEKPQVG